MAPPLMEQRLLLHGVPWSTYETLLACFEGRHLRLTYDRGELELMVVSWAHEWAKKILARMVEALTEELNISLFGLGNTTFRQEALARGLEPDECYYLRERLPLSDPNQADRTLAQAPDLVLEVEISRSVLDRMAIYAALGIPEIWCTDGDSIRVYQLQEGHYIEIERSGAFPWLPMTELASFVRRRGKVSDTQLVKEFRQWVRTTIAPRLQTPSN